VPKAKTESDDDGGIDELLESVEGRINFKRQDESKERKFFTLQHRESIQLY
jgi:hypothetical protein